ncbi:MAG: glycogen/starch synthase [Phycisphaerae bacterium]
MESRGEASTRLGSKIQGGNGQSAPSPEPFLFEVGWEVCWQLGGIYTVLKTKAYNMTEQWQDRYCLVGPYNPVTAAQEFERIPATGELALVLERLRGRGLNCYHGRWLVPGRPRVILIDHRDRFDRLHIDKFDLFNDHGIETPANDGELNECIAFGFAAAEFFEEVTHAMDRPVLAHFHEWMAGVAVPRIAHRRLPISTVFTTHATLLGRYLASDMDGFYDKLGLFNPDEMAGKYNIMPRHQLEKAAAHASTVFTTVSQVTANEAQHLLGRVPDAILPNGLDVARFEVPHEFQHLHAEYKEAIHQFVMGHFFPSYEFDLNRTLYVFTSGRYEYKNKGIDLFIEGLYRLNERLKQEEDPPTVVGFIVTRADVKNVNVDVLQKQAQFDELARYVDGLKDAIGKRLFYAAAAGRPLARHDLIDEDAEIRLKRAIAANRSPRWPTVVTHDLMQDANDPVLMHLRHRHLVNAPTDPVKVVFHPQFLKATSPLIGLDYDQFVRGCHMGIFPSYYEPWGYTPMECVALGLPSVTTDLSGFGAFIKNSMPDVPSTVLKVLDRAANRFDYAAEELADHLHQFSRLNRRERIELRNGVEGMSEKFDWDNLIEHYHDAHDLALIRKRTTSGRLEVRSV